MTNTLSVNAIIMLVFHSGSFCFILAASAIVMFVCTMTYIGRRILYCRVEEAITVMSALDFFVLATI